MQKYFKGVITIYLSLTLILTSALIFTLIESARVSTMNSRLRSITYMACDSVFSEFAEPVFEDYGVMLLWSDEEEFLQKFDDFCRDNLSEDYGLTSYTDIYKEQLSSSAVVNKVSPTADDGQEFADQVLEYMQYYLANDAADRILDNVSIFDQGSKVSDFMDKISEYGKVFTQVEDAVGDLKEKIDDVRNIARDPSILLDNAMDGLNSFSEGGSSSQFTASIKSLKNTKDQLTSGLKEIQDSTETYYEKTEDAKTAISELQSTLEVSKAEYNDEVYEIVSEQLEEINQKSADTDYDYYLVGANKETTDSYIEKLGSLDYLFDSTSEALTEENAAEYKAIIQRYQQSFSDFNLDSLGVNFDTSEVAKEDSGFLSDVSDFFNSGILGFVAGDVSEKSVDTSQFPSKTASTDSASSTGTSGAVSASDTETSNLLSATSDKALFGEYILTHFSDCSEDSSSTALDYEAEYIIAGKDSDKANLSAVVGDIVLLRTGCNLISILKSSAKKAETLALATSLVGFTGMPIVIKIFQILLISAWALAESIADVKALIGGHKIRTIKNDDEWYISLAGIKNFGSDSITPSGTEQGLSYESYLRLLLLMQNKNTQYFRTMDMIQANMCLNENADFRIIDTLTEVTVQAEFTAPVIFLNFPFVKKIVGSADGNYTYTMTQKYAY